MTTIEITCCDCGRLYSPSHDDMRRGPAWYRRGPACWPADVAGEKPGVAN